MKMEDYYCSTCGHKSSHRDCKHHEHKDSHHKPCDYHHHHCYRCGYRPHHCYRSSICDDHFRLRLGGLYQGLNFRLRQLIGCKVDVHLENGQKLSGKISQVGSNFVELIVDEKKYPKMEREVTDKTENAEEQVDDNVASKKLETYKEHKEHKEHKKDKKDKKRKKKKKKHSMIFSIDKINNLKY